MKCENQNIHYEAFYQDSAHPDGVYYKGVKVNLLHYPRTVAPT
jgi:hypothetical protein